MNQFSCVVENVFNITGRGTILTVSWDRKGELSVLDTLLTSEGEEMLICGIEMTKPLNNKLGLLIKWDFEKSKQLVGKTLTKKGE